MATCVDEANVHKGLELLKLADTTKNEYLRTSYIYKAVVAVARETDADRCPTLGAPDDFALLYAWTEADDASISRLDAGAATSRICAAHYVNEAKSDLALGWIVLYTRQHTSQRQLYGVVQKAMYTNAAFIGLQMPALDVDNATATQFQFTYYKPGVGSQPGGVKCHAER